MQEITIINGGMIARDDRESLIKSFIESLDVMERTRDNYTKCIKVFFEYVAVKDLNTLTRKDIIQFKQYLAERGLNSNTIATYIAVVRCFFVWAESEFNFPNIAKGVKARRPKGTQKEALTIPQIKNVLDTIDRSSLSGKRDYALFNLLIRTGLRTKEVVSADVGDMRQSGGEVVLYIKGKGRDSKDAYVVLPENAQRPIREYKNERKVVIQDVSPDNPLFTSISPRNKGERLTTRSISRIIKNRLIDAGLDDEKLTAHSTRHTAVTLALLDGAGIQEVQKMARHADVNTTLHYAHNTKRLENASEKNIDNILARNGIGE